jgi:putative transposase
LRVEGIKDHSGCGIAGSHSSPDGGSPHLAPSKIVQYIKGRSSRRLQEEFPQLRKRYWGQHLWARGYFCATVGAVDEKTIMAYIENQKWDDDDQGFKITAPTEP